MGTWGSGNFENDTAGDFFLVYIDKMIKEIEPQFSMSESISACNYWGDVIPAIIEMICALVEKDFHCICIETKKVERWKRIFMERWELTIDECSPNADYRVERKSVLNQTFDKFINILKSQE